VGGFNWLSLSTRPDITPVTSLLAGHLANPSQGHLDHAKHVLQYLKGTPTWGIRFTQPPTQYNPTDFDPEGCLKGFAAWPTKDDGVPKIASFNRLDVYTDSNWGPQDASHPKPGQTIRDQDAKSLLGNLITYMGGPLEWKSIREQRTSYSVCESEIKAMRLACEDTSKMDSKANESIIKAMSEGHKSIMQIRNFLEDLGATDVAEPTPYVYCDNQGAVAWVHSESISRNMRQYNLRQCCVRESVRLNEIKPVHIPGTINPADLFTKEMRDKEHFFQLRASIMCSGPDDYGQGQGGGNSQGGAKRVRSPGGW
jgi:hypothetical protein